MENDTIDKYSKEFGIFIWIENKRQTKRQQLERTKEESKNK